MSDVLDRLRKKRGFPVTIGDETFHVRSLTIGELKRLKTVADDDKTGFMVGCTLCADEGGKQAIPPLDEETDADWSKRVVDALADVPSETIRSLSEGIAALSKTPSSTAVAKNS